MKYAKTSAKAMKKSAKGAITARPKPLSRSAKMTGSAAMTRMKPTKR